MSDLADRQILAALGLAAEPLTALGEDWIMPPLGDESDGAVLQRIKGLQRLTLAAGHVVIKRRAAGRRIPALREATLPELDGTAELLLATLSATEAALETEAERSLPRFKGEPS